MNVKEVCPVQEKIGSFFVTVFCRTQECRLQPAVPLGRVWTAIRGPAVSMRLAHFLSRIDDHGGVVPVRQCRKGRSTARFASRGGNKWMLCLLLAFGITGFSGSLSARSRDDVLASAYRCAGIGASAQWLDCYYGAAQPVRADLGLAPAPQSQLRLLRDPPSGLVQNQATRDATMAAAARCGGDGHVWLSCYYAATAPMRELLHLSALSPAVQTAKGRDQASLAASLGAPPRDDWLLGSDRALEVPVAAYRFRRDGVFTVTLANGEVWRQLPGDTAHLRLKKLAQVYIARIAHGALGSTNLSIVGKPGIYRVERVHRMKTGNDKNRLIRSVQGRSRRHSSISPNRAIGDDK